MKIARYVCLFLFGAVLTIVLPGCGEKHDEHGHAGGEEKEGHGHGHGHGHHEGHDEGGGAQFKEGKGILLSEETMKVLEVETAEVAEEKIQRQLPVTLQVYRAMEKATVSSLVRPGFAYASGLVSDDQSKLLAVGQHVILLDAGKVIETNATLVHLDLQTEAATRRAEIIVEIPDTNQSYPAGKFLQGIVKTGREETTPLIPKSALLPAAEGNFVYVVNGEYFFRTAVEVGSNNDGAIEITGGLYPGDKIVTKPVETLWLIELRAVKGGGHSH